MGLPSNWDSGSILRMIRGRYSVEILLLSLLLSLLFAPAARADGGVDATPPTASRLVIAPGDYNYVKVEVRNTQRAPVRVLIDLQILNPNREVVFASMTDDPRNCRLQVKKAWFKQFKITPDPKIDPRWVSGEYRASLKLRDPKSGDVVWSLAGEEPVLFKLEGAVEGGIEKKDTQAKGGDTGAEKSTGAVVSTGTVTFDDAAALGRALSDAYRDENINAVMDLFSKNLSAGVSYAQAQEAIRQFFNNVSQVNLIWYTDGVTANPAGPSEMRARADLQCFDPGTNKLETTRRSLVLQLKRESDGKVRIVSGDVVPITTGLPAVNVPGVTTSGPPTITSGDAPLSGDFTVSAGQTRDFSGTVYVLRGTNFQQGAVLHIDNDGSGFVGVVQLHFEFPDGASVAADSCFFVAGGANTVPPEIYRFEVSSSSEARFSIISLALQNAAFIGTQCRNARYKIVNPDGSSSSVIDYTRCLVGTP